MFYQQFGMSYRALKATFRVFAPTRESGLYLLLGYHFAGGFVKVLLGGGGLSLAFFSLDFFLHGVGFLLCFNHLTIEKQGFSRSQGWCSMRLTL